MKRDLTNIKYPHEIEGSDAMAVMYRTYVHIRNELNVARNTPGATIDIPKLEYGLDVVETMIRVTEVQTMTSPAEIFAHMEK